MVKIRCLITGAALNSGSMAYQSYCFIMKFYSLKMPEHLNKFSKLFKFKESYT